MSRICRRLFFVQLWMMMMLCISAKAQGPTIAYIQPDAAAPGMTVAVQILAHVDSIGAFGTDGIAPQGLSIQFIDPTDTQRIVVGIPVVSWQGRMIQVPFFVQPNVSTALPVAFRVVRGSRNGNIENFFIVQPQSTIRIFGSVTLGDSALGRILSPRNTLVVRGLEISGDIGNRGGVYVDLRDPDITVPGNPRLLPVTILSQGPVHISNVDLHFEAQGKSGAPGGGGGGSGNEGSGGFGFTGGGSTGPATDSNVGSGSDPSVFFGGRSLTGVKGGASDQGDQGGGGGTGHPFGTSGESGQPINNSSPGGYGGGSAGGETEEIKYGGGGGAFATNADPGDGNGNNAGHRTGGRLLLPLAGGSGGGAGNSVVDRAPAGSGGGGGGSLEIVAFDSLLLSSTNFLARGDSGTTGIAKTGGGGGGSGGGIVLASNTSIRADRLTIDASGGKGGSATTEGLAGGDGSDGMVRFDGLDTCINCILPDTQQTSLSQRRLPQQTASTIVVGGLAGSPSAFTDSIRIYYRNYHTGWVRVDTVSFLLNGKRQWKKTIPSLNDSLLFVSAYQKIRDRRTATFDQEPEWISNHVSHQIIRSLGKPQAITPDTVRFPDTKIGRCFDTVIHIRNAGEASLEITSIDAPAPFSISPESLDITGYSDSVITISLCPEAIGCVDTTIVLHTNTGDRPVVVTGCGIKTDERVLIDPKLLIFNDTKVGECDTATVLVRSQGVDETIIELSKLFDPPFFIDTVGKKKTLKKNETEIFTVTFCPTDSGLFRDTTYLIGPESMFAVQGKGLRRILAKRDTVFLDGVVCFNNATVIEDTIYNRGNDTINIDAISTSSTRLIAPSDGPWKIAPANKHIFAYRLIPTGVGSESDSARYLFGADSVAMAYFYYTANQRVVTASVPQFYSCAEDSVVGSLEIVNAGSRAVSITVEGFGEDFTALSPTAFTLSQGNQLIDIRFKPKGIGDFFDTIDILVNTEGCGDTVLTLVLHGIGTHERLVFSKDSLNFGDVLVDDCAEDSIFIANVCGPPDSLKPDLLPTGFSSSLEITRTLSNGEGLWVIYKFCPEKDGPDSAVHRITTSDGSFVDIRLFGVGKLSPTKPKVYLSLSDAIITIGQTGPTILHLDSISSSAVLTELAVTVRYDPALLKLLKVEALAGVSKLIVDSSLGRINLKLSGASLANGLVQFTWLGLLGEESSTEVELTSSTTTPQTLSSLSSGRVDLVDCFDLAGNIKFSAVTVDIIKPQPIKDILQLLVHSQSNLNAHVEVTDASGRIVMLRNALLTEGQQVITLPVSEMSTGAYWIKISTAGSSTVQRFWK